MKPVQLFLLGIFMAVTPALAADRLTDRDVKQLVARIEDGRDRFDDALDDTFKHSIVREAGGEVNVSQFLNDFQENIDRLEGRLKPEYAASAEVSALLSQASAIERYFRQQPPGMKGESEWNRLAADLKVLAVAYGAGFPLVEGASVRRIGDRELAAAAGQIAGAAKDLKRSLDNDLRKDPSVSPADRDTIVGAADLLAKDAKALASRVKDGKPSSAEADRLMERAARLRTFIESHKVPASSSVWTAIAPNLQTVAGAYRTSPATAAR